MRDENELTSLMRNDIRYFIARMRSEANGKDRFHVGHTSCRNSVWRWCSGVNGFGEQTGRRGQVARHYWQHSPKVRVPRPLFGSDNIDGLRLNGNMNQLSLCQHKGIPNTHITLPFGTFHSI